MLLCAGGAAHAETSLFEYGVGHSLRPAEQLAEASCDVTVDLKSTIADLAIRQRIVNPGPATLSPVEELELPSEAQLYAATAWADRDRPGLGIAVPRAAGTEQIADATVLGADTAIVMAIPSLHAAHRRFRMQLEPLAADHEISAELRWAMVATVRNGVIQLVVPGRVTAGTRASCRGVIHATPGPGATVSHIRVAGHDIGPAGTFLLESDDLTIEVELGFARTAPPTAPLVWLQTQRLEGGWSAQALTVIAPLARANAVSSRRALLVIDGSRSMELVGRTQVAKVVRALAAALPQGTELEAILYDRTATRLFGNWRPADAPSVALIESAIANHPAVNGTDPVAALELARRVIDDGTRGQAMVILISDGSFASLSDRALVNALGDRVEALDFHAIVLDPAHLTSSAEVAMRAAVARYGGSYAEVRTDDLDQALSGLDGWIRPSLVELAVHGSELAMPAQLLAGSGTTQLELTRTRRPITVSAGGVHARSFAARTAPGAPIAQLALSASDDETFLAAKDAAHPDDAEREHARRTRDGLRMRYPVVGEEVSLAVLTSVGKVARTRRDMVAGGGPYTRMIALADPSELPVMAPIPPSVLYSAVDKITLERLFRDQLRPRALICYEHALAKAPTLSGSARFELEIGRGEVIRATVAGLGNDALDACLVDAAYSLELTLPDPAVSLDDLTIAHYPLTFSVQEQHPLIVLGDADSSSPLDIDAIKGGVPRGPVRVDASTPLGGLRP